MNKTYKILVDLDTKIGDLVCGKRVLKTYEPIYIKKTTPCMYTRRNIGPGNFKYAIVCD